MHWYDKDYWLMFDLFDGFYMDYIDMLVVFNVYGDDDLEVPYDGACMHLYTGVEYDLIALDMTGCIDAFRA